MSVTGTTMNVAERYPIFLQMATFTKAWEHHSLADEALKALEDEILLFLGRSQNDYGEELGSRVGANPLQDFKAIHLGEFQVQ